MTDKRSPVTLATQHAKATRLALFRFVRTGVNEQHCSRYDYRHESPRSLASIFYLLPQPWCGRYGENDKCAHGVFIGLRLHEILTLCFAQEAIDFLLKHSYNDHLFWELIGAAVYAQGEPDVDPPYSLEHVRARILKQTPFDNQTTNLKQLAHLKAAVQANVQANAGHFDPTKLKANDAVALLFSGLLLRQQSQWRSDLAPVLVVNPMWAHLVSQSLEPAAVPTVSAGA